MPGTTGTTQFSQVHAREVDFVTRFNSNWDALREILSISRPIRKTPGTQLVSYKASMVDSALQGGDSSVVAEGTAIPYTQFKVEPASYEDLKVEKYAKQVSIEAVAKYGAAVAVEKTDDAFLVELQNKVLGKFYTALKSGTLVGTQTTWQRAMAIAKGAVLNKFADMHKDVTEVVAFVNVMDVYDYIGDATITVQTNFGLQYVKDFLGYSTVFLLPDSIIPSKTVIATPVENIDLYYIDPADSDFAKLGLEYTVEGETNLIGFHAEGNYSHASGDVFAIMGLVLWAEYVDGIAKVTVGSSNSKPAVAAAAAG